MQNVLKIYSSVKLNIKIPLFLLNFLNYFLRKLFDMRNRNFFIFE